MTNNNDDEKQRAIVDEALAQALARVLVESVKRDVAEGQKRDDGEVAQGETETRYR